MHGALASLSWPSVGSWAQLTGHQPTRDEISLLFTLDAILCGPGDKPTTEDT